MATTPPKTPPPQLKFRFCQTCDHVKDPKGQFLRHMTCCGECGYYVCRECFVQNFRYRKARDKERAERRATRAEKEAQMKAQGRKYSDLTFEELLDWSDDSEWEDAAIREGPNGAVKKRKKLEKDCPEDCYGECCLRDGWVWLQSKYSEDNARPDLFDVYREWYDEADIAMVDALYAAP
jgi:hypothetical protein